VFELYPDLAPKTVAAFKKYADEGLYDKTAFFRVAKFAGKGVLMGGDPWTKEEQYCYVDEVLCPARWALAPCLNRSPPPKGLQILLVKIVMHRNGVASYTSARHSRLSFGLLVGSHRARPSSATKRGPTVATATRLPRRARSATGTGPTGSCRAARAPPGTTTARPSETVSARAGRRAGARTGSPR